MRSAPPRSKAWPPGRLRQRAPGERQGREADRQVDGEQPRPGRRHKISEGHRRPEREADADHESVEARGPARARWWGR